MTQLLRPLLALVLVAPSPVQAGERAYESPVVNQRLRSGVHLGGIGCGKIELMTDATFGRFTGNTNWDRPVDELPLSFFSVAVTTDGDRFVRALAGGDPAKIPSVENIRFDGRFARADVAFEDEALPLDIRLMARSSFVVGDVERSSIPGALFRFEVRADQRATFDHVDLTLAFENLVGCGGTTEVDWTDRTGSFAEIRRDGDVHGVQFGTTRTASGPEQNAIGTLAIATAAEDRGLVAAWGSFNGTGDGGDLRDHLVLGDPPGPVDVVGVEGELHPGAILTRRLEFNEQGLAVVEFALAWHAPHHVTAWDGVDHGKAYVDRFADAFAVSEHLLSHSHEVRNGIEFLEQDLRSSTFPEWLVGKLLNNLGPMFAGSVLTKDGRFAVIESPVTMRGALGTMDQRLSAHAAWTFLFPELDERELRTFARLQVEGAIPHFTGNLHLHLESAAVPYGVAPWPDLAGSFVLQVDAHARWTGDRAFADEMLPHVRRAMHWIAKQDRDGDGIPEGGSTFDNRPYKGAVAYTASVYLAALAAAARIERRMGDEAIATGYDETAARVRHSLVAQLWNGRWFDKAYDPISGERSHDCFMAQLAGEFRARLTGLGPTVDPEMSRRATISLLELNGGGRYLPALDIAGSGLEAWNADCWTQYTETYLLMQAMQQGFAGEAMRHLKRMAEAQRFEDESPFDVALVYDIHTGHRRWGDQYMTSPASWFLPRVMAGFDIDRWNPDSEGTTLILDPRLPAGQESFRIPVFHDGALMLVRGELGAFDHHRRLRLRRSPRRALSADAVELGLPAGVSAGRTRLWVDGVVVEPEPMSSRPGLARFLLPDPQPRELFLVAIDSGVLEISADAPPRPRGSAVSVVDGTELSNLVLRTERDHRWPLVVRTDASIPAGGPAADGDPLVALETDSDGDTTWLAILPEAAFDSGDRVALEHALAGDPARLAAAERDIDASRNVRLDVTSRPPSLRVPDWENREYELRGILTDVTERRDDALGRGDFDMARQLTPVSLDVEYIGNPLSDWSTRLRITAIAPEGRYRIDALRIDPPDGVEVVRQPEPPSGAVFAGGQAYQGQVIVRVDPSAQWKRQSFGVEVEGAALTMFGPRPAPFRRETRISIGYDFARRFVACGPFVAPESQDPHDIAFAPETDGVDLDETYGLDARWTRLDTVYQGILDLREVAPERYPQAAAYAAVDVIAPYAMPARAAGRVGREPARLARRRAGVRRQRPALRQPGPGPRRHRPARGPQPFALQGLRPLRRAVAPRRGGRPSRGVDRRPDHAAARRGGLTCRAGFATRSTSAPASRWRRRSRSVTARRCDTTSSRPRCTTRSTASTRSTRRTSRSTSAGPKSRATRGSCVSTSPSGRRAWTGSRTARSAPTSGPAASTSPARSRPRG